MSPSIVQLAWAKPGFALLLATMISCATSTSQAWAQASMMGIVRISGQTKDLSGMQGMLETNTPIDAFGGLSAIEYTGMKNRYLVLSDRGAGDGAASFPCRFHEIELTLAPDSKRLDFELLETVLLRDASGKQLTGNLGPMSAWDGKGHSPSFDPEGIRCLGASRVVISDEYGPNIDIFARDGKLEKSVAVPSRFSISERRATPWVEGTFTNRGLEGVAITPDHSWLVAAMQGPLVQDGRIENQKCLGLMTRWFVKELEGDRTLEWIYPLDDESTGVSEVLAIDAKRFMVLERDSKAGELATIKKIYLADASRATDVSNVDSLRSGVPEGARTIDKKLMVDLLDPEFGLSGASAPEKPEGLAWGPKLSDGRTLLVVCFDNDFDPQRETIFAAFALDGI